MNIARPIRQECVMPMNVSMYTDYIVVGDDIYAQALYSALGVYGSAVLLFDIAEYSDHVSPKKGGCFLYNTVLINTSFINQSPSEQFVALKQSVFSLRNHEFSGLIIGMVANETQRGQLTERSIVDDLSKIFSIGNTPGLTVRTMLEPLLESIVLTEYKCCGIERWREWVGKASLPQLIDLIRIESPSIDQIQEMKTLITEKVVWVTALGLDLHNPVFAAGFWEVVSRIQGPDEVNEESKKNTLESICALKQILNINGEN